MWVSGLSGWGEKGGTRVAGIGAESVLEPSGGQVGDQ